MRPIKFRAWQTEEKDLSVMSDTPFRYPEWLYHYLHICELIASDETGAADEYLEGILCLK